jgi:hypothetical protein
MCPVIDSCSFEPVPTLKCHHLLLSYTRDRKYTVNVKDIVQYTVLLLYLISIKFLRHTRYKFQGDSYWRIVANVLEVHLDKFCFNFCLIQCQLHNNQSSKSILQQWGQGNEQAVTKNSPSPEANSCSATHSIPCLLHNTYVHYHIHHTLTHFLSPNFFSPPTFCSHTHSSLNITITPHV